MDFDKLNKWADLLLDTGKRNNLINFRDSKMGTVEVVLPDFNALFLKAEHSATFEVYDPKLDDEDDEELIETLDNENNEHDESVSEKRISKEDYIETYRKRLKKNGQVLIYNSFVNPLRALRNIGKKAKTAIEETGVNIAYMAFGFINWAEKENLQHIMRAPILLAPISVENDSAIDPYHIKITDSEIIVNPTFSFKLKNDYGIELPEYDEEDIDEYLEKVEEKISKLKWTITKECKIGIFSFLKINMHKDLKDNAPKILNNKGVRALLGEETGFLTDDETDENNLPKELFNVVDADSSQTEAIELARSGKSFVLQGPPGTGKSQTITNIIAEGLASGKKILFVSEKLAALNVVYDKLKKAGLEEFCLELHSHKANKRDVINELCHTLKAQRSAVSGRAQKEIESKSRVQKELDEYAVELHKTRPVINKSLYNLYEEISACRKAPDVEYVINDIKIKGEEYIDKAETALTRYVEYTASIGTDYHQNVWYGYINADSSYQVVAQLKSDLESVISLYSGIKGLNKTLTEKYSISASNINQAHALHSLFNLIKKSEFITPSILGSSALSSVLLTIKTMYSIAKVILDKKKFIDKEFDEDIYKLDGKNYYKKLAKQFSGFFSRLFNGEYKGIINEIKLCKKDGKKVNYKFAVFMLEVLRDYQQKLQEFNLLEKKVIGLLGDAYNGVYTDFNALILEIDAIIKINAYKVHFGKLVSLSKTEFIDSQNYFSFICDSYENYFKTYEEAKNRIENSFDLNVFDVKSNALSVVLDKYQGCLDNIDKLDNWCEFVKLLNAMSDLEIRKFVDFVIKKKIKPSVIVSTYKKAFYMQWIDAVLHDSPVLIKMSRIPHDEAVKLFKTKDELGFEINKAKIKAKLSAERPSLDMVAQGSAVSILLREGEKKRKQKGIRLLLEELGELVQTLKPCFLMSPLSVSTFLSPDMKFDVVVFDEASQIFPQDAVGAIYRGKQLIVVGDSKQMPPSNFFNSMSVQEDDDDETDDITDFESILDLCSTTFPQKRLKWHYRSRFEQLISFSNKNFYDNDLVTFPSSMKDSAGLGVDYFYVDGVFDRRTKTNRVEAEKIVDLVFENIEKYPNRSLGVVAFSISQQNLIDKLIAKRRQKDPSKEAFFKSDKIEPFFVKNLETVQGDERDTIIFSVAYAKDAQGKLLLNFGPLNREGGERRLNVAVTRAKFNVQLVSSMRYTDIDLSRTKSVGARLLREYLDFAENGEVALERSSAVNPFAQMDAEFEKEVFEFLTENGFKVDMQVGCSAFKIALAVKHPKTLNYVLAIECDGYNYRSSKNTRDRDRLRQEILERMGWKFYRIWSTDWFRNKRVEKERLLERAKLAIENYNGKVKNDKFRTDGVSFEEVIGVKHFEFPKYEMANEFKTADQNNFDKLKVIRAIVELEGPLSEEWLLKRIAFLFGREKVTSIVRDEFNYIMRNCSYYNIIRKNGFLYMQGKEIPMLRVPFDDAKELRDVKYIAPEELALGMREILKQNITVEKNGLFRLLVQQLGFTRIGDAMIDHLESALNLLKGEIEVNGDILSLK